MNKAVRASVCFAVIAIALVHSSHSALASSRTQVVLQEGRSEYALGMRLHYLEDAKGQLTIAQTSMPWGVMAYEMFTGKRPFEADNPVALAYQHVKRPPRDPLEICPDLSPRLTVVILCCLQKAPPKRFRHVGEILPLIEGLSA